MRYGVVRPSHANPSNLIADAWDTYARAIEKVDDPLELTYRLYQQRSDDERLPQPTDTTFMGHPLFGCFWFAAHDSTILRVHFLNNDVPGARPLSRERMPQRYAELRRLFTYVRYNVPDVTTVRGNSWLYNLPAYTRLFPPTYSRVMPDNTDSAMHMLGLWAQCYDRFWEVKPDIAAIVMERIAQVASLDDLRHCFPYQRLRPTAPIADFFAFYDIPA